MSHRQTVAEILRNCNTTVVGKDYCPLCGDDECHRERRPNGNSRCKNDHTYPSKDAIRFRIDTEGYWQLDTGAPAPVERWTDDDQREFAAMMQRRDRVLNARRDALKGVVVELMRKHFSDSSDTHHDALVDAIADFAEPLIDALKPYDSKSN